MTPQKQYKEITIEDIRKWKEELNANNVPSKKEFSINEKDLGNGMVELTGGSIHIVTSWDIWNRYKVTL